MQKHAFNGFHSCIPIWWELLAYALIIVAALILKAMQVSQWAVIPLFLIILLVHFARVHLFSKKEDHNDAIEDCR